MTPIQKSIEKQTFSISIQMACFLIVLIVGIGWKGSDWFHGIMDGQKDNTREIVAKIDAITRDQEIINKGQSDSLKMIFRIALKQDTINLRQANTNQINIDTHRQIKEQLVQLER